MDKGIAIRDIKNSKIQQKKLLPGDTIIEKSGGSPNQPVGRVVYFDVTDDTFLCNNFTSILRPKPDVDKRYFFWSLFNLHQRGVTLSFQNKTTGIINLQLKRYVEKAQIPLPPLSEQRRLAARLDQADAVRQKSRALVDAYAELGRSVFLEVFGDPVRNERGWEVVLLEDIIADGPTNGLYKPSKEYGSGNPIVRIDSFYNGPIELSKLKRVKATKNEVERYNLKNGDILINRVNSRSHLGKCGLVHGLKEDTVFESNMMRIRFDQSRAKNEYLMQILQHPYLKNQILNRCKDAVNQSSINQTDVKSLQIPLPPLPLQTRFAAMVANIEAQRRLAERQLEAAEAVFGGVLQGTFEG